MRKASHGRLVCWHGVSVPMYVDQTGSIIIFLSGSCSLWDRQYLYGRIQILHK